MKAHLKMFWVTYGLTYDPSSILYGSPGIYISIRHLQTLQNWEKQKTKKRIKNANCILQRLRGEKAFGGTKKGVSEE